jgi:uncharacterized 2Fe-2S/4Fe-4S cluster protein (DUF4445 family)
MSTTTHTLHFPNLDREISSREDETLFQSARRHGVRIVGACGGRGTCGSCVVRIDEGEVSHVNGEAVNRSKWQRACQLHAHSDCTVEVAPRSLAPVVRAEADSGTVERLPLQSAVQGWELTLPDASLQDTLSDHDRVLRALDDTNLSIDLAAAKQLPGCLRAEPHAPSWSLRTFEREGELIGFAPVGTPMLGLAIDLGTTNAAGFLVDLESGERLASLGIENPQVAWGADLVSRLNHAAGGEAQARELHSAAIEAVNSLAHDLCFSVGRSAGEILDVAICGNTAMHHLLLDLPVRQLGRAPFVAAVRGGMDLKARELGLKLAPGAWVHVAPNVGGFVGGDHVTALLATEASWSQCQTALVMDVGTNTEISLIHEGRFLSASAPSGPALEGGHIGCGMRAAEGAIERVRVEEGRLRVETIGGKQAIGLCGSGVLDTLATLHRGGLVSDQGRLAAAYEDIVPHHGKRAVRLAKGVYFTQGDVRAVQLAKAAIRTATELLLDEAGLQREAIERFIIAGAFGAYIDIESGIRIGLFPDLPRERFQQVGNAAGVGVRQMLASTKARERAKSLAESCRYLELSTRGDFQKRFLHHIGLNQIDSSGSGSRPATAS